MLYCILLGSFSLNHAGTRPQRIAANTHSSTGASYGKHFIKQLFFRDKRCAYVATFTLSVFGIDNHIFFTGVSREMFCSHSACSENAVVSPENLRVWVRLQNAVVTPVNNHTLCEHNHIKDSNTGLTTVFCCCVNVAIYVLTCLVEVSVGQQYRAEGLRTLVVWWPVFVSVSFLPSGPVWLSCPVPIGSRTTDLIGRKSASRSPAHSGTCQTCVTSPQIRQCIYLML